MAHLFNASSTYLGNEKRLFEMQDLNNQTAMPVCALKMGEAEKKTVSVAFHNALDFYNTAVLQTKMNRDFQEDIKEAKKQIEAYEFVENHCVKVEK